MLWIRKGFVLLLSTLLFLSLLGVVGATTFNTYFAKPDHIKTWLQKSDLYGHFVDGVIQQSKQSTGDQDGSSVSLSDTAVQEAARSAFSSELIQKDVNTFLDRNYMWLRGEASEPRFNIDLTDAKQEFADKVGQYVTAYLKNLPVCTDAQQAQITNPNQDPLGLTCRPNTLDPQAEGTRTTQQLASSGDFLSNPIITQDTLKTDNQSSGEPYYVALSFLPTVYSIATKLPLILGGLSVILGILIVFVAPRKRAGVRRIAVILLLAGVILLLEKLVADIFVRHFNLDKLLHFFSDASTSSGPLQQSLTNFVRQAEAALTKFDLYFGLAFIVAGLLIIAVLARKGKRQNPPAPSEKNESSVAPKATRKAVNVPAAKQTPSEAVSTALKSIKVPSLPTLPALKSRRAMDVMGPKPTAVKPKTAQPKKKPAISSSKSVKLKTRKPPRLIQ